MSNFTSIKAAIVSILQANVSTTSVNYVYDYANEAPDGYPSIDVTSNQLEGEFADTVRNRRDFTFSLLGKQERTTVGSSEAERIINKMADDLIAIFDSSTNLTLQNQTIFYEPIGAQFGYIQGPDIDIRTVDVTIKATVVQ